MAFMGKSAPAQVRWPRLTEYPRGGGLWWRGYAAGVALPVLIVGCVIVTGHPLPTVLTAVIIGLAIVAGTVALALLVRGGQAMYFAGMSIGGLTGTVCAIALLIVLQLEKTGFQWVLNHLFDGFSLY